MYVKKTSYVKALQSANVADISQELKNNSSYINLRVPYGAMDIFLSRGSYLGVKLVLSNPDWDPNYIGIDGLSLLERAMIRKEQIALDIMQHPNFNPKARLSFGRTIEMAAIMLAATRVYTSVLNQTDSNARDISGKTASDYLEKYGYPNRSRLVASMNVQKAYEAKLMRAMASVKVME